METKEQTDTERLAVSRVVQHPVRNVWGALMAPHGAEALLGEGGRLGNKGEDWQASDGSHGVTRSFHPVEQIRFSWHADADAPSSMVDLHLKPVADDSTQLEIVHSQLPDGADVSWLTSHWESALERIDNEAL